MRNEKKEKRITLRIDEELWRKLKIEAFDSGLSLNKLIIYIIREYFKKQEKGG